MLPRLRRHRRRANERCDWPKAAIDRRGVSTPSGPKRLICEVLTLLEHDIAMSCDIANHLPCTASLRALGHPAAGTRATLCRPHVSNEYTSFRCSDIQPRAIRVTARSASWPVAHRNMRQASVMSRDRAETIRTAENKTRSYFRACDGVCWAGLGDRFCGCGAIFQPFLAQLRACFCWSA